MQRPVAYFSADYTQARTKFLDAAKAAGARIEAYRNPSRGPEGSTLFTDTAWLGPMDAKRVLVTLSATHGVEGFCGSAVQSGSLAGGLANDLPSDTAFLSIHAINPYGFAWLRRVTEDNVDLNRNFIDFDAPWTLRTHLGMHGSWHRYAPAERWKRPARQASVVLGTDDGEGPSGAGNAPALGAPDNVERIRGRKD